MEQKLFSLDQLLNNAGISTRQQSAQELLEKFKLNWEVKKEKLILADGIDTGFYGIVRQDNRHTFATCKESYLPFQNEELLELVNRASGTLGLNISRGGSFKGGALPYLQLESGLVTGIGENNDSIKKFITAMNSHNGSMSLKWGLTNITISCQNTFWHASREVENSVKHSQTMQARVNALIKQIEKAQETEKTLYETFFKLSEAPVKKENIVKAVKTVLDIDLEESTKDIATQALNRLNDLSSVINSEMGQKGATLWGLFSGVTKFTTHLSKGTSDSREQSKAVGSQMKIDNEVFEDLAELVLR